MANQMILFKSAMVLSQKDDCIVTSTAGRQGRDSVTLPPHTHGIALRPK